MPLLFVAYGKNGFSHDMAPLIIVLYGLAFVTFKSPENKYAQEEESTECCKYFRS